MNTILIDRIENITQKDIVKLQNAFLNNSWDLENCQKFIANKNNYLFIAKLDNIFCGFLTAYTLLRLDKLNPEIFLYEIEVNRNFRRQGIGKQLIQKLQEIAQKIKAKEIFVLTNASNTAAVNLYKSTGGKPENPDDVMFVYHLNGDKI